MKKPIKNRILKVFLIVFLILVIFILILNIPIINLNHEATDYDYSNWMKENLESSDLVVDTAMLGAHDAFSSDINIFSDLDPYETNGLMQGVTGVLIKGFTVKQAVCQVSDAKTLLESGVRYLDIRLSYFDETWYTKHNYISSEFQSIANQMTEFLNNNDGEYLILDFQHINGLDYDSLEDYIVFKDMLDDYGLLDYAYSVNDLSTLTYGNLTNNGSESSVIIISKFANSENQVLQYDHTIISNWADSDDFEYVYQFLTEEAESVSNEFAKLRVMQAVTTMQMNGAGVANAVANWSLIHRANNFNYYLINQEGFQDLLNDLPIIMVDYANSNSNEFNDNMMGIIIDFN